MGRKMQHSYGKSVTLSLLIALLLAGAAWAMDARDIILFWGGSGYVSTLEMVDSLELLDTLEMN